MAMPANRFTCRHHALIFLWSCQLDVNYPSLAMLYFDDGWSADWTGKAASGIKRTYP